MPIASDAWRSAYLVAFNTLTHLRELLAADVPGGANTLYLIAIIEHAQLQCEDCILREKENPAT